MLDASDRVHQTAVMSAADLAVEEEHPAGTRQRRGRLLVVLLLAFALVTAVFLLARSMSGSSHVPKSWVAGVAHVGGDQFSVEHDGWTYGSDLHVMSWIDPSGSWHDQGVPSCLRVEPGASVPVRFQAREVTVDQQTWRPVVAIDCR